jgi:hypothetical protein
VEEHFPEVFHESNMRHTIILIHGRGPKPPKRNLQQLWLEALEHGVRRDFPERMEDFQRARKTLVYYGDLTNAICGQISPDDISCRQRMLDALRQHAREDFCQSFYERLPGKSPRREFFADAFAELLVRTRIGAATLEIFAPELLHYWERDSRFADEVVHRMRMSLRRAMTRGERIAVVSHSLGSVIVHDALWELSHLREYVGADGASKVDLWLTLGAPLSNGLVRRRLRGGRLTDQRRCLRNVVQWINIAAEDDFIAHDETLADEFTLPNGIQAICDERVFNIAVHEGRSDPHSDLGYLVHPVVAAAVASWLARS